MKKIDAEEMKTIIMNTIENERELAPNEEATKLWTAGLKYAVKIIDTMPDVSEDAEDDHT